MHMIVDKMHKMHTPPPTSSDDEKHFAKVRFSIDEYVFFIF